MRTKLAFSFVIGMTMLLAVPALGAPTAGANTDVISVTCDGVDRLVIVSAGNSAWGADAAGNPDGTQYILKEIDIRAYPGALATEPTSEPLFSSSKTFGKKTGLGEFIHCTFQEQETTPDGTVTVFGDAWVVQVR